VHSDTNFVLVVAWALAVLQNRGPYPVIVLSGEQASAKSTFSAILRALLDPNTARRPRGGKGVAGRPGGKYQVLQDLHDMVFPGGR
jgi:hypothetical protein